jgi:steroid 5-alpha reductase family enzyme
MATNISKTVSLIIVSLIYILSLGFSWIILGMEISVHPILKMFIVDIIATVLVFVASFLFRNSSIYDPYWSVFPIFTAFYWFLEVGSAGNEIRNIILLALVTLWGVRLTLNWGRGWKGMAHQDWRYSKLEEDQGNLFWLVSFSGIHLFPTIVVFLGLVPIYYIFQDPSSIHMMDIIALIVTLSAIIIETLADEQLKIFLRSNKGLMKRGIWSWSRHPNYFGEILFWLGLLLFLRDPIAGENYYKISGVIAMIFLFNVISIPMMEKRQISKDGYKQYQKQVSKLIPLPPGKKAS